MKYLFGFLYMVVGVWLLNIDSLNSWIGTISGGWFLYASFRIWIKD